MEPTADHHAREIHFKVDGEPVETTQHELTPNQIILDFAHLDPKTHYLVQIKGHEKINYRDKGEIPIELHNGIEFQVISTGPTPVSDATARYGVAVFIAGLRELGYQPASLPNRPDHVYFDYEVTTGRFAGRKVRLGFIVPGDFPMTPPSGPHVSPHIHPINGDGPHPCGHVHLQHSVPFKDGAHGEWQYWSRPFAGWTGDGKKPVASYMSHIWQLWDTQ